MSSIDEAASQLGQLVSDPRTFMAETFDVAKGVYDAVQADARVFAAEFLGRAWPPSRISTPTRWPPWSSPTARQ